MSLQSHQKSGTLKKRHTRNTVAGLGRGGGGGGLGDTQVKHQKLGVQKVGEM